MSPESMASIGIGSSAAGGIVGAIGALDQGKAAEKMFNFQAGVALVNKQIALQNRDYAYQVGEDKALQRGMVARQQTADIKVAQSGSNLNVNTGSAADVRESSADVARMDLATIRGNAARTAYGYTVESVQQDAQSKLYTMAGSNARRAGYINAITSLLSGASSVSSKWIQAKQAGIYT